MNPVDRILNEIKQPVWAEEAKKLPGSLIDGLNAYKEGRWNFWLNVFLMEYRENLNKFGSTIGYSACRLCGDSFLWKESEGVEYERRGNEGRGVVLACLTCYRVLDEETVKSLLAKFDFLTEDQRAAALENWRPRDWILVNPFSGSDDPDEFCSPWKTIKAAIEHSGPKTNIILEAGDYPEDLVIIRPVIFEAEEGVSIRSAIFPIKDNSLEISESDGIITFTKDSYPVIFQKFECLRRSDYCSGAGPDYRYLCEE